MTQLTISFRTPSGKRKTITLPEQAANAAAIDEPSSSNIVTHYELNQ